MNDPIRNEPPSTSRSGRKVLAVLSVLLLLSIGLYAARDLTSSPSSAVAGEKSTATARAVAAANTFLDMLDANQREKVTYEFGSAKKSNWSNLPVTFVPRNGVRLGDLSKKQRAKAMDVVAAVLSEEGYQKVIDIMDSDQQLAEGKVKGKGKSGKKVVFGADEYFLAIFGQPSQTKAWMVQFGGHHLGVNVTVIGKHFVLTPTHTGAQPTLFKRDGKDVRPLGPENDIAFKLINSLDDKQRTSAIIGDRPQKDLLLGPGSDGKTIEPAGIKGSALTADQRGLLVDLIGAWVNIVEPGAARARMTAIQAKIGETYFAWSGPTENGKAVSFRVQGPTVVIEYAPQGGTDHIHTVIRNPENDYGAGQLKR